MSAIGSAHTALKFVQQAILVLITRCAGNVTIESLLIRKKVTSIGSNCIYFALMIDAV